MFFNVDNPPVNPIQNVIWPLICVILAVGIWFYAFRIEQDGGRAKWKWAAVVPLLLGLIISYTAFRLVFMPHFMDYAEAYNINRKGVYTIYAACGLPILGLLAMIGLSIYQKISDSRGF